MDWRQAIESRSEVMHGAPCIKGTRIPVSVVLDNLAAGVSVDDLLRSYPSLTEAGVRAAIAYAADIARARVVELKKSA